MKIKDELVLHRMTQAAAEYIGYNTIGASQTISSNTPGYYILQCTCNAYTLQGKYICHAFDPLVIIPEGELFCPDKFMTLTRITFYWYHDRDEAIPVMVKLKQVIMP